MEWSLHDVIVFGFFIVLVVFAAASVPSLWRRGSMPDAPGWWPYSENFWRGLYRSLFVGTAGAAYLVVLFIAAGLWQWSRPPAEQGLPAPLWVQIVGPGILFVFVGMVVSVILFNRPSRVVPPAFRDQQGLLTRRRRE